MDQIIIFYGSFSAMAISMIMLIGWKLNQFLKNGLWESDHLVKYNTFRKLLITFYFVFNGGFLGLILPNWGSSYDVDYLISSSSIKMGILALGIGVSLILVLIFSVKIVRIKHNTSI